MSEPDRTSPNNAVGSTARKAIIAWALIGVSALLLNAIVRLFPLAWEPIESGMTGLQWAMYGGMVVFMAYSEGYRGFHLRFSPRVVARASYLADHPTPLRLLFATPFVMSLFHASKKGLLRAWILLTAIVALVMLVRLVPQPYRGIIDGGVVVGLFVGLLSVWFHWGKLATERPDLPEDLPSADAKSREVISAE